MKSLIVSAQIKNYFSLQLKMKKCHMCVKYQPVIAIIRTLLTNLQNRVPTFQVFRITKPRIEY